MANQEFFIEPKQKPSALIVDPPVVVNSNGPTTVQKWWVGSIVNPDDRVKNRFLFEANKYLHHNVNNKIADITVNVVRDNNTKLLNLLDKKISQYSSSSSEEYKIVSGLLANLKTELQCDEEEFTKKVLRQYGQDYKELIDGFDYYKTQNEVMLSSEFKSTFGEGTSIRGIKNRGAFEDLNEAKSRASFCQNLEPAVDTFVAPIGHWLPIDFTPDAIKDQEYQVEALNNLMHKYNENVEQRNDFFNKRRAQMIEETSEKKEKAKKEELLKRYKERLAAASSK
jgi:hypothetical protein